ncbi:MAG: hypothetical protein MUP76_01955 [Acidimicrobiia bacterium]|nr:hypothetical protein [Acidimicrobiia bacterium]
MRRIAILLTVLALLATACGDDTGSVLDSATTTAAGSATTNAGAAPSTSATDTGTQTTQAGSADSGSDVQTALAAYETAAFRAVYRFGQGDDEQIITISQDPNLDPPVSVTLIGPDGDEGRFLTIGDRTLICGPPGDECIEFPAGMGMDMGQALLGPVLSGFLLTENLESTPGFTVEEGTATIAGRSGLCFTFTPSAFATGADVAFIRQCVDSQLGFILLIESMEDGAAGVETLMELLEFGLPTPADFQPSGPVTTMPGG